ncbi:hypothetical protein MY8738_003243 [Beauveria namnaoensis]
MAALLGTSTGYMDDELAVNIEFALGAGPTSQSERCTAVVDASSKALCMTLEEPRADKRHLFVVAG